MKASPGFTMPGVFCLGTTKSFASITNRAHNARRIFPALSSPVLSLRSSPGRPSRPQHNNRCGTGRRSTPGFSPAPLSHPHRSRSLPCRYASKVLLHFVFPFVNSSLIESGIQILYALIFHFVIKYSRTDHHGVSPV